MALPRKKHQGRGLGFWLLLALILHAEGLLVVGLGLYFWGPRNSDLFPMPSGPGESIEIATIDDETAQKLLAELDRAEEKAKEEQAKKELEAKDAPGQVVDLPKPLEEKRPDQARFASEYDSSVEKETRKYGRFDQKSRQGDRAGEDEASRNGSAGPTGATAPPGALAMRTPGQPSRSANRPSPPQPAVAPLAGETGPPAPEDPEGVLAPGARVPGRSAVVPQAAQAPSGGPVLPPGAPSAVMAPSQQQIARAIGSGTQDHLKDLDEGNETALNAKKWKFASFFNRVKSQVREHWKPVDVYRRRDPTGSIYGNKDRYTLLRVQLKPDGSLANLTMETPSGVEFLDDEAIEAFKQAQPFPNPPPQLVDASTGMIDFRFGFYFEISGAPRFKIFKYGQM